MSQLQNVHVEKKEGSSVEITGEIPVEQFESHRAESIKNLAKDKEFPGFRKGHVPQDVLTSKLGDMPVLEEMARNAISQAYPTILSENKVQAIGAPEVTITKLAKGEPLGFKIKTAVMPQIELADYKMAAKEAVKNMEKESTDVTDEELSEVIENIRKQQAHVIPDDKQPENPGELPEINDDFVKTLGDFKNVDEFKDRIRENMKKEKEARAQQKKRTHIIEKIIQESTFELPDIVVEGELDTMMNQFKADIARSGLKFDEYLKHIKKTEEDLRKEWRVDAEKRAKTQLILNKIATQEKIFPDKDRVDEEVKKLLEQHKDATEDRVRVYVETVLTNEKVFEWLEKQAGE